MPHPLVILANVLIALALAGGRIAGERGQPFQAAAHLYVGGLVAAAWFSATTPRRWLYGGLAAFLTAVETLCFFQIL